MRIIAGSLKGRRLEPPRWEGLRPTSDALRETLFNVLGSFVRGARVLDAFAGTGALGIEALSRGAVEVVFVDDDARARALVAKNLAICGVTSGCAIIRGSALRAIRDFERARRPFDIVLLDPPYADLPDEILGAAAAILAPDGVVVLEHTKRRATPEAVGPLMRVRLISSGDSALSLYNLARREMVG